MKLMKPDEIKQYFKERSYVCQSPYNITNEKETVFVSAGIQPLLRDYRNGKFKDGAKIYISQPVLRSQFADNIGEGYSIAFVNLTTASFNNTETEYDNLVSDWLELFYELGIKKDRISFIEKDYERQWGDLLVKGKTKFYYCDDIELGDTTFFTSITKDGSKIGLETMSDVGFGLERIRWVTNKKPFFELYSNSDNLSSESKALLSALALLAINNVNPSNKNSGYRARLFSKKLVSEMSGKDLSDTEIAYLNECINYWKDWQETETNGNVGVLLNEYSRNCNKFIADFLKANGYDNVSGINTNLSKQEYKQRLLNSHVKEKDIDGFYM